LTKDDYLTVSMCRVQNHGYWGHWLVAGNLIQSGGNVITSGLPDKGFTNQLLCDS
jgi:hypothetical protein